MQVSRAMKAIVLASIAALGSTLYPAKADWGLRNHIDPSRCRVRSSDIEQFILRTPPGAFAQQWFLKGVESAYSPTGQVVFGQRGINSSFVWEFHDINPLLTAIRRRELSRLMFHGSEFPNAQIRATDKLFMLRESGSGRWLRKSPSGRGFELTGANTRTGQQGACADPGFLLPYLFGTSNSNGLVSLVNPSVNGYPMKWVFWRRGSITTGRGDAFFAGSTDPGPLTLMERSDPRDRGYYEFIRIDKSKNTPYQARGATPLQTCKALRPKVSIKINPNANLPGENEVFGSVSLRIGNNNYTWWSKSRNNPIDVVDYQWHELPYNATAAAGTALPTRITLPRTDTIALSAGLYEYDGGIISDDVLIEINNQQLLDFRGYSNCPPPGVDNASVAKWHEGATYDTGRFAIKLSFTEID